MRSLSSTPLRAAAALGLAGALACASTQEIHIACVPEEVPIYVDGRQLEAGERFVVLRTDEPHTVFVKGGGVQPQLVVLEPSVDAEGRRTLGPDHLCIEVVPRGMERRLELELEDE